MITKQTVQEGVALLVAAIALGGVVVWVQYFGGGRFVVPVVTSQEEMVDTDTATTRLSLRSMTLDGDSELSRLTKLEDLHLSECHFGPGCGKLLLSLTSLRVVFIRRCVVADTDFWRSVAQIRSLRELYIEETHGISSQHVEVLDASPFIELMSIDTPQCRKFNEK